MPHITHDVTAAVARLRDGGLVAIPTETVYGLAAEAANPAAVAAVYALKGRPATNPLIVHVADPAWLYDFARDVPALALRLIERFWPGPLTLVLPARDEVPRAITANQDSVALRQPAHPLCLAVLRGLGSALVAPSANRFMSISPTTAAHVAHQFAGEDLLILDGGPCTVGLESTIVSVLPGHAPTLLRPGMLDVQSLEAVAGTAIVRHGQADVRAPGQHRRHYAPRTPTQLFDEAQAADTRNPRVGWIFCAAPFAVAGPALALGSEPDGYARRLYDALYQLDAADLDLLLIQRPPARDAWRAVTDRLQRAATSGS
ncbi:MAG: L-threonylcarbamoyladenylate synthase [Pseudomonadales bacterium]